MTNSTSNILSQMGCQTQAVSEQELSTKGFIVIDMDGTALVEKIDKYGMYGLTNSEAHMRESLVAYMAAAAAQDYDIYILTARPEIVERLLDLPIGTKSTYTIREHYAEQSIAIKGIERAATKGSKMNEMLGRYEEGAQGFLFDDQLKQLNSVANQANDNLFGIDINSYQDIMQFIELTEADLSSASEYAQYHPDIIVEDMLNESTNINIPMLLLRDLGLTLNNTSLENLNNHEEEILYDIIRDLSLKLSETSKHNYTPDLIWVGQAATQLNKLIGNIDTVKVADLRDIASALFDKSKVWQIEPNSRCEANIKALLDEVTKRAVINELKEEFATCLDTLDDKQSNAMDGSVLYNTLEIEIRVVENLYFEVDKIDFCADNINSDISNFIQSFEEAKEGLTQLPSGADFIDRIKEILSELPIIGQLFKSEVQISIQKCSDLMPNLHNSEPEEHAENGVSPSL